MCTEILRVGELKELLEAIPDDTPVIIANDAWYNHIGTVELPDGEDILAVTFSMGASFDARFI